MRRLLLYLASAVPDAVALLIGGFLRLVWGRRWVRKWGVLWVELSDAPGFRGWFARGPYKEWGGTTFGHVILIQAGHLHWTDATDEQIGMVEGQDPHKFVTAPDLYDVALTLSLARHELVHVEAFESEAIQNSILFVLAGLVGRLTGVEAWPWVLAWWALGGLTAIGSGNITAWLRGEHPYLGSHFEESARAVVTCRQNPELSRKSRL